MNVDADLNVGLDADADPNPGSDWRFEPGSDAGPNSDISSDSDRSSDLYSGSLFHRFVRKPIRRLLLEGASTPHEIALTLALGNTVGINPIYGTTTTISTLLALKFGLNLPLIQVGNWMVWPHPTGHDLALRPGRRLALPPTWPTTGTRSAAIHLPGRPPSSARAARLVHASRLHRMAPASNHPLPATLPPLLQAGAAGIVVDGVDEMDNQSRDETIPTTSPSTPSFAHTLPGSAELSSAAHRPAYNPNSNGIISTISNSS